MSHIVYPSFYLLFTFSYIGCIKEGSRKKQATYEINEYDFAIFE